MTANDRSEMIEGSEALKAIFMMSGRSAGNNRC